MSQLGYKCLIEARLRFSITLSLATRVVAMEFLSFDIAKKTLALRRTEVPVPAPDEVRVRVAYSGICGTDLHILDVGHIYIRSLSLYITSRRNILSLSNKISKIYFIL